MKERPIIIGTRGSRLALVQSQWIKVWLEGFYASLKVELKIIKTKGDQFLESRLNEMGGEGVFVKELEESLLLGQIDVAVHSMKDVPNCLPKGLVLVAVSAREDARDVFISLKYSSLASTPEKVEIGTSSVRRRSQLLYSYPKLVMVDIRGNIDSRIRKLKSEGLGGIILAAAGLKRLGMFENIVEFIPVRVLVPAVGQGIIGIETRASDWFVRELFQAFNDSVTWRVLLAERACMRFLNAGCHCPMAAYGSYEGGRLKLLGMLASLDGKDRVLEFCEGSLEDAEYLGKRLGEKLLKVAGDWWI